MSAAGPGSGADPRRAALGLYIGQERAAQAEIGLLGDGLINDTYLVRCGLGRGELPAGGPEEDVRSAGGDPFVAVLQRVNPIFGVAVHLDIEAVTRHLRARGMAAPLLYRVPGHVHAPQGEHLVVDRAPGHPLLAVAVAEGLAVEVDDPGARRQIYRLMSFVPGQSVSAMAPALAREAGRLTGWFHDALSDLQHRFHFSRPGAHDLAAHLAALARAFSNAEARTDPGRAPPAFFPLAEEILLRARDLPGGAPGPPRVCHGDLKIGNLRFDEAGRGVCLLDLDTLAHLPLCIEMGDALRSWCNPSPQGEDDPHAGFDLGLFELAMAGYAERAAALLLPEEREGLVAGVERIALELAARFCADVVNDRYFRYDPARFPSRAAHNLVRAQGQLSVARAVATQRAAAEAVVRRLF